MMDPGQTTRAERSLRRLFLTGALGGLMMTTGTIIGADRQPAVAGQFYPAGKGELSRTVKACFSRAPAPATETTPLALIVPHAGYVYSGEVAAAGYRLLPATSAFDAVFILGPAHRVGFDGAAVYVSGDFQTPLGTVPVNRAIGRKLLDGGRPFVERDDAHAPEHSLEVQLPFLQERLTRPFTIVPILLGSCSPGAIREIAARLKPYLTGKNLFILSTDFAHYPPAEEARKSDQACADAIVANSPGKLRAVVAEAERRGIPGLVTAMCGYTPVSLLLEMTNGSAEFAYTQILHRTSGDVSGGDPDHTVGYWAIALTPGGAEQEFRLSEPEKRELKKIANATLEGFVRKGEVPRVDPASLAAPLRMKCGAFVTLRKHGELRGCIGRFEPGEPLWRVVQQMAVSAATEDPRFPRVEAAELGELEVEISVLTPLRKISSIDEIRLGVHGIYIMKGGRGGTFLPQVAAETGWTKEEFLGHCARDKAGIGWDGWRDAEIFVYEAIVF